MRTTLAPLGGHRLTVGGEGQWQMKVDQVAYAPEDPDMPFLDARTPQKIASAYLVDDWTPTPNLRVNAGVRADDYLTSFGLTLNPRLAVIARPYSGGNTKLLAGRAKDDLDIRNVLAVQGVPDRDYLESWAGRLNVADRLARILARTE